MKTKVNITIVVDANPIIAALIGGSSREIFFDRKFGFITTEFTIEEVKKYFPVIAKKAGTSEELVSLAFSLLPVKIYPKQFYYHKIRKAKELIGKKDKKDVDILALALISQSPLWSQDKHFEGIVQIKLLKTKDLL